MLAFVYVASFVVGAWAPFVWAHREVHGVVNPAHLALTLFNAVNVLISRGSTRCSCTAGRSSASTRG